MKLLNLIATTTLPYVPKPVVRFFAKRYIAGETLAHAIEVCKNLNAEGAMCTIDHLGESVKTQEEVGETVDVYMKVLESIQQHKLDSNISIKPTSFGALIGEEYCVENIHKVLLKAKELGNFVRIDMEDHPYTDMTLRAYENFRKEHPQNVGTVLQSYMKRTCDDADQLSQNARANFRLCKGIYKEPPSIAYQDGGEVNDNYLKALDLLFSRSAYVGIATHDPKLVEGAYELIKKYNLKKEDYEFQMLLGVRADLRRKILADGHRLRVYVPFGVNWYAYSVRRLKENPDIAGHIIRGFFFDRA